MPAPTSANPNVPGCPMPIAADDTNSLAQICMILRMGIMALAGQNTPATRALLYSDIAPVFTTLQTQLTQQQQQIAQLTQRVTTLEEEFASLPPPP